MTSLANLASDNMAKGLVGKQEGVKLRWRGQRVSLDGECANFTASENREGFIGLNRLGGFDV